MNYNKLTGLQNLGNTCYLNSALQLLFKCEILNDIFIKTDIKDNNILKGYTQTIKDYYNNEVNTLGPVIIYKIIGKFYSQFRGFDQNDSHEFIICLIELIEKTFNDYDKTINISKHLEELFDCKIKSEILCLKTKQNFYTDTNEKFLLLPIPNKNKISLDDCLKMYQQVELLNDDNKYFNDKINEYVDAKKKYVITNYPRYLFIVLKRFNNLLNKISKNIDIPINYILNNSEYCLKGFIIQSGSLLGGHYISYININNNWKCCNDDNITNIDNINEYIKQSYILLYIKN
tara:strand:- start:510 stop:1376 length:867 start_codon:yes stop_codon:yes gene_type:complete